jgi:ADP-heptose:LPS heptosyltransferase
LKVSYQNILVIQTAFIGDAILASSIVEKLHHFFPYAQISILVRKGNESLYENHPFLKEVLIWNKQENKYGSLLKLCGTIRKRKFDAVINLHRYSSSGFLTAFSGARHTAGYKQNFFSFSFNTAIKHIIGDGRHETERYDQLIEDFTDSNVFKPRLYPSQSDLEKVSSLKNGPYVTFSPASVWFTKQLPESKWIELGNKITPEHTIYLLGAKNDVELCERIASHLKNKNVTILAGELSLLQSCALMRDAKMNYVNDSAPQHLASSVNAPVTTFFCSTVPAFGFGPLSDYSKVIEVKNLYCKPCGLHGYKACPEGHFKCGLDIDLSHE